MIRESGMEVVQRHRISENRMESRQAVAIGSLDIYQELDSGGG